MKLHEIEIEATKYEDIRSGAKAFHELVDDKNYQLNDLVHFNTVTVGGSVTNTNELYKITYILRNSAQLAANCCVLNIKKVNFD